MTDRIVEAVEVAMVAIPLVTYLLGGSFEGSVVVYLAVITLMLHRRLERHADGGVADD